VNIRTIMLRDAGAAMEFLTSPCGPYAVRRTGSEATRISYDRSRATDRRIGGGFVAAPARIRREVLDQWRGPLSVRGRAMRKHPREFLRNVSVNHINRSGKL